MKQLIPEEHRRVCVIPEPKHVEVRQGKFVLPPCCRLTCREKRKGAIQRALDAITDALAEREVPLRRSRTLRGGESGNLLFIGISSGPATELPAYPESTPTNRAVDHAEGYVLDADDERIAIWASTSVGLFYGVQTLLQLLHRSGRAWQVPCLRIADWPDLAMRGIHLNAAQRRFKISFVEGLIRTMGRYKLNTLLFEPEDSLRYRRHPLASHARAWTPAEIRELVRLADGHGVQVIPLLQCLGHADYILRHAEYAHLREGPEIWSQYCPSNPGSLALFTDMLAELLPLFDNSPYVHVGGDETYFLGSCPACRQNAAETGRIGLYLDHVNRVCDQVLHCGRTPMLWDDMLAEDPGKLGALHPDAVLVYWDYTPADVEAPHLLVRNHGDYYDQNAWQGRKWRGAAVPLRRNLAVEDMPPEMLSVYCRYMQNPGYPRFLRHYPNFACYTDAGRRVVGAAAAVGGDYNLLSPNYPNRAANIVQMAQVAYKSGGEGALVTTWPGETFYKRPLWFLYLQAAEHTWYCGGVGEHEFCRKFAHCFHGLADSEAIRALSLLGEPPPLCYDENEISLDNLDAFGSYTPKPDLATLCDRRIERFETDPEREQLLVDTGDVLRDAREALRVLERQRGSVRRGHADYRHALLAARLTEHKARQVFLFHAVESWLRASKSETDPARVRKLASALQAFRRDQQRLQREATRIYADALESHFIKTHIAVLFKGEKRKVREYLRELSTNGGEENGTGGSTRKPRRA